MITSDSSGNFSYTRPHIPPHRTSADGRVALAIKMVNKNLNFSLFAPEGLAGNFTLSAPDTSIIQSLFPVNESNFYSKASIASNFATGGLAAHRTICDVGSDFPSASTVSNPQVCANDSSHDCYFLTVIMSYIGTNVTTGAPQSQLWGTPITVEVSNPKTARAAIVSITPGTPRGGPLLPFSTVFEPMTTTDGRLLVGRIGGSSLTWTSNNGVSVTGNYDMIYSVASPGHSCDVTQWAQNNIYPISHAPFDPTVNQTYPFAYYPFRDPENNAIADGVELGATYPWIDRRGRNLFFSTFGSNLYQKTSTGTTTAYPTQCVPNTNCNLAPSQVSDVENPGNTRGLSVMGLWTSGKMVMLDGVLNNIDFGLMTTPESQRLIQLYQPSSATTLPIFTTSSSAAPSSTGDPTWVQVGAGRDINVYTTLAKLPSGPFNTTLVDSLENLFMYLPKMKFVTSRDVVWTLNNGKTSQEVAFDDFLDPNVLIYSEMNASLTWKAGALEYQDGINTKKAIHVQNAATSLIHAVPPYGIVHGTTRIEPVALGGISGRGLWLNGTDTYIQYPLVNQTFTTPDLFFSMFVDPRPVSGWQQQQLVTFPNNTSIVLMNNHTVGYVDASNKIIHQIKLPWNLKSGAWENLQMSYAVADTATSGTYAQTIRFYVRGMAVDEWTINEQGANKLFDLGPGNLLIGGGASSQGGNFRGWIDEVKLIKYIPTAEVICNHARGTLLSAPKTYTGGLALLAQRYPAWTQTEIQNLVGDPVTNYYGCGTSWTMNEVGYVAVRPSAVTDLRTRLTMGNYALVYGQPRPDFSNDVFCQSCHVNSSTRYSTLQTAALQPKTGVDMQNDSRRQPLQPPRLMFGNIPADLFPNFLPSTEQTAPPEGALQDQWFYPRN